MRVLGIDPGSHRLGLALVTFEGQKLKLLWHETFIPRASGRGRYKFIAGRVDSILKTESVDLVAIEKVFVGRIRNTAVQTGECRGAIFTVLPHELPLVEVFPSSVKKAACGNGRADKKEVRRGLEALFRREIKGFDDGVDAAAIALCGEAMWRAAGLSKRA